MEPSLLTKEGDWTCLVCDKQYPCFLELELHIQLHFTEKNVRTAKDKPTSKCDICQQYYYSEDALNHHINVIHETNLAELMLLKDKRQEKNWLNSDEQQTPRSFYCKECKKICNLVLHLRKNIVAGPVDYFD
ncbi:Zinc finger C2H2-type [Cinara cedri]|uniref:Zinc finger C2H2-type n=1 Tax=Cinara cedri TaxID=506608 RepID=A0A5E4NIH1_9HEMI|nr:Zinc finger C2H2-type [Cinara cedri]